MSSPWSQAPRFETQKCVPPHPPPLHVQTCEPLSALAGVYGGFLEPKRALPPALGWAGGGGVAQSLLLWELQRPLLRCGLLARLLREGG